jgi:hypothetical protein
VVFPEGSSDLLRQPVGYPEGGFPSVDGRCMEAYAGRGALERSARKAVARGERTRLFEIMEALCAAAASGRASRSWGAGRRHWRGAAGRGLVGGRPAPPLPPERSVRVGEATRALTDYWQSLRIQRRNGSLSRENQPVRSSKKKGSSSSANSRYWAG